MNSEKYRDTYFQLAGDIALNCIIGTHDSQEKELQYYKKILTKIMYMTTEYIKFANKLIYGYIERKHRKIDNRKQIV